MLFENDTVSLLKKKDESNKETSIHELSVEFHIRTRTDFKFGTKNFLL